MTDRALGRPPETDTTLGGRKGLETTTGTRVMGPNEAAWTKAGLAFLSETPLRGADRLDVLAVTIGHMRATAHQLAGVDVGASAERILTAGIRLNPSQFPELGRAVGESETQDDAGSGLRDGNFSGVMQRGVAVVWV